MTRKDFERLPTNVSPEHYTIFLDVDLDQCAFDGKVTIKVNVVEATNLIKLNSFELTISKVQFQVDNNILVASEFTSNTDDETLSIRFESPLKEGQEGQLIIDFNGILNDKMKGFYRSKQDNGFYAACTHFEPTGARMAFPCWDEPALKATFDVSLRVPESKTAVSNIHVREEKLSDKGFKLVNFDTTPRMSTYLVAFVVGDFDFIEDKVSVSDQSYKDITVRVYTPAGKKEQGEYALKVGKDCLALYNGYFGIPYPMDKCDLIAISDFPIGAMENWGLVTFAERRILCDPENTSSVNKQFIALVTGHELAHMWFGNLVTMVWWTDLWLKEGFAEFIMYVSVGKLYPELQTWSTFVADILGPAMELDALDSSHPIEIEVGHPSEVNEIFDTITYMKGASIIRMLESYIGVEDFKKGLRHYLNEYQYGNATTINLWTSFEKVSGLKVGQMMSSWTQQKGFPVVEVVQRRDSANDRVTLHMKQKKFSFNGALNNDDKNKLWAIPVTVSTSSDPDTVKTTYLFDTASSQIVLDNVKSDEWVKLNVQSVGFYHVLYEDSHLKELLPAVESMKLSPLDRWGLQNDLFALVQSGQSSTIEALRLMKSFVNEKDYAVWAAVDAMLEKLNTLLSHTNDEEILHVFGREIFQKIYADVGWNAAPKESHTRTLLRSLVIHRLGAFGDETVINEALKRFNAHVKGSKLLPADLRSAVYRTVAKSKDEHVFESLMQLFRTTDMREEKNRVACALGNVSNQTHIELVLKFAMSTEVRSQDTPSILAVLSSSKIGRDAVWSHFKENCDEFRRRYVGNVMIGILVKYVTENFADEAKAVEIEQFFQMNPIPGTERNVTQSIETIRIQAKWLDRDLLSIRNFLSKGTQ